MTTDDKPVRIGPITLFTLIAVLCLATLAVLSISTANASYNMAVLQGESMTQQYEAESAAQHFVALASQSASASTRIERVAEQVEAQCAGDITVTAQEANGKIEAEFACGNGRILQVTLSRQGDGSLAIDKWHMTAKQNSAAEETLWLGN